MSKAQQVKLNIDLSDKLANYLMSKPDILKKYSGSSYVVFSVNNSALNKLNLNLIAELQKEGKTVVKAQQSSNLSTPWILTPLHN